MDGAAWQRTWAIATGVAMLAAAGLVLAIGLAPLGGAAPSSSLVVGLALLTLAGAALAIHADRRRKAFQPPADPAVRRWRGWRAAFIGMAALQALSGAIFVAVVVRLSRSLPPQVVLTVAVNLALWGGLAWWAHRRLRRAEAAAVDPPAFS